MVYYVKKNNTLIKLKDTVSYLYGIWYLFVRRDILHLRWQQLFSERLYLLCSCLRWVVGASKYIIVLFTRPFL